MLVLTRKIDERIVIDNRITITVLEVKGSRIKLGISAPDCVPIQRGEIAFSCETANDRTDFTAESAALDEPRREKVEWGGFQLSKCDFEI